MRAPPGKTTTVWCAIAMAIAEHRESDANLFIEDASDTATTGPRSLDDLVQNVAKSILRCGADQGVLYKEIFVGHKSIEVDHGTVGCALTCAPYVTLPKSAIPHGMPASALLDMTISDWERQLELAPLPHYTDFPTSTKVGNDPYPVNETTRQGMSLRLLVFGNGERRLLAVIEN